MEVTQSNLPLAHARFQDLIRTAEFCSLDLEMTGLYHSNQPQSTLLDSPEERYTDMKRGSSDFTILQLGLCLATRDPHTNTLTYHPFNIYTFPTTLDLDRGHRLQGGGTPELPGTLQLDIGAVEFNKNHHMDFQKWVQSGIPYWKTSQISKIDEYFASLIDIEESYANGSRYDFLVDSPQNRLAMTALKYPADFATLSSTITFVHDALMVRFINKQSTLTDSTFPVPEDANANPPFCQDVKTHRNAFPSLPIIAFDQGPITITLDDIPRVHKFVTRALKEQIECRAPRDKSAIYRVEFTPDPLDPEWRFIPVIKIYTPAQYAMYHYEAVKLLKIKHVKALGASLFWNSLKTANIPVIVHNGMFDLMFCYSHFENNLPQTYKEFQHLIAAIFPSVFDTKYIYNHPITQTLVSAGVLPSTGRSTSLSDINHAFETFTKQLSNVEEIDENATQQAENDNISQKFKLTPLPPPIIPDGFTDYTYNTGDDSNSLNLRYHEAGYDAYVTAKIFAQSKHYISDFHRRYHHLFKTYQDPTAMIDGMIDDNWQKKESIDNFFDTVYKSAIFSMRSLFHFNLRLPESVVGKYRGQLESNQFTRLQNTKATKNPKLQQNLAQNNGDDNDNDDVNDNGSIDALGSGEQKLGSLANALNYLTWFDFRHSVYHPDSTSNQYVLVHTTSLHYEQQRQSRMIRTHFPRHIKYSGDLANIVNSLQKETGHESTFLRNIMYKGPTLSNFEAIFKHSTLYGQKPRNPFEQFLKSTKNNEKNIHDVGENIEKTIETLPENTVPVQISLRAINSQLISLTCTPPVSHRDLLTAFHENTSQLYPLPPSPQQIVSNFQKNPIPMNQTPQNFVTLDPNEWDIIPFHIYLLQRELDFTGQKHALYTPLVLNHMIGDGMSVYDIIPENNSTQFMQITNNDDLHVIKHRKIANYDKIQSFYSFIRQIHRLGQMLDEYYSEISQNTSIHTYNLRKPNQKNPITNISLPSAQGEERNVTNLYKIVPDILGFFNATSYVSLMPMSVRHERYTTMLTQQSRNHHAEILKQQYHIHEEKKGKNEKKKRHGIGLLSTISNTFNQYKPFIVGGMIGATTTALTLYGCYSNTIQVAQLHTQVVNDLKPNTIPYFSQYNNTIGYEAKQDMANKATMLQKSKVRDQINKNRNAQINAMHETKEFKAKLNKFYRQQNQYYKHKTFQPHQHGNGSAH